MHWSQILGGHREEQLVWINHTISLSLSLLSDIVSMSVQITTHGYYYVNNNYHLFFSHQTRYLARAQASLNKVHHAENTEYVLVVLVHPTRFGLVAGRTLGIMFGVRETCVAQAGKQQFYVTHIPIIFAVQYLFIYLSFLVWIPAQ